MTGDARQRKPEARVRVGGCVWEGLQPSGEEICAPGQRGFRLRNTIYRRVGVKYGLYIC